MLLSGTSLFVVIKYARLKPISIKLLGYWFNTVLSIGNWFNTVLNFENWFNTVLNIGNWFDTVLSIGYLAQNCIEYWVSCSKLY